MRRLAITLAISALLLFPAAAAAHPSENRNEAAVFGGPHCHTLVHNGKLVVPSHRAHAMQIALKPNGTVFAAAACP
jgi:hypothetical protein